MSGQASNSRPAAGRKTFTGCWTCRTRKLKCDETWPQCNQCTRKGLVCEGYSTRLQWLPCETGKGDALAGPVRTTTFQRRQIAFSTPSLNLSDSEIDHLLNVLDGDGEVPYGPETRLSGPFGLFSAFEDTCVSAPSPTSTRRSSSLEATSESTAESQDGKYENVHNQNEPSTLSASTPTSPSLDVNTSFQDWVLLQEHTRFSTESKSDGGYCDDAEVTLSSGTSALLCQPAAVFMKPMTRLLFNHYIHQVVNIFSVIENPKTPWKSIHLPRSLQGSSEIEVLGGTSHTRSALLHAILSVSAYCLANRYDQEQREQAEKWRNVGQQLRSQAVTSLHRCLAEIASSKAKPKYKELLAAMLSMVTIDVASGETETCQMHLSGCESLIRATKLWKLKYSSKARSLHRIFFYLRVMHATTSSITGTCNPETVQADAQREKFEVPSTSFLDILEGDLIDNTKDAGSCEFIYGVPPSLFILLEKTNDIVQRLDAIRKHPQDLDCITASELANTCDNLEGEILDWPVDMVLSCLDALNLTPEDKAIIEHQTRAFHQAIIIYFSQHVRSMHQRHLRPYVEAVINHAEAIEDIKKQHEFGSGSLFWPCFIAAAEAIDDDLQQRFMKWYDHTKVYGLAGGLRGRDIVTEVWHRRRSGCSRELSSWRKVMESQKVCLMLT